MMPRHVAIECIRRSVAAVLTLALIGAAVWGLASCGAARLAPAAAMELNVSEYSQVALGQEVFMTHCHQCHPGGSAGLAPAILGKPLPGFLIKTQIRQGFGAMPSFSQDVISGEEADAVIAYIRQLRTLDAAGARQD